MAAIKDFEGNVIDSGYSRVRQSSGHLGVANWNTRRRPNSARCRKGSGMHRGKPKKSPASGHQHSPPYAFAFTFDFVSVSLI
jgi:hypothetical protein